MDSARNLAGNIQPSNPHQIADVFDQLKNHVVSLRVDLNRVEGKIANMDNSNKNDDQAIKAKLSEKDQTIQQILARMDLMELEIQRSYAKLPHSHRVEVSANLGMN